MHPQNFKEYSDHCYKAYCNLHDEVHRLIRENKMLTDEINKLRSLNNSLSIKLQNSAVATARVLKMGSGWVLEGENLMDLSSVKKFKFSSPICNVKISPQGQIAFTCNKKIFLVCGDTVYLVENMIRPFDPQEMRHDLVDLYRAIFDFDGEDLIALHRNTIMRFRNLTMVWSVPMPNVFELCASEGTLYVGTKDMKIHVIHQNAGDHGSGYPSDQLSSMPEQPRNMFDTHTEVLELKEPFRSFVVRNGSVILYSDNRIGSLSKDCFRTENFRIFSADYNGTSVFYGGDLCSLKIGRALGSFDVIDSIALKKTILAVKLFGNRLFVATQDRSVNIIDLESKKSMRIALMDNIVDMACNESLICFVDNNGGLRVWEAS